MIFLEKVRGFFVVGDYFAPFFAPPLFLQFWTVLNRLLQMLRRQVRIPHREQVLRVFLEDLALPAPKTGRQNQPRGSKLDPFKSFIEQPLPEGVWNAEVILHKIKNLGTL
ncbi:hypothetical protein [Marinimicrobium sp. C2-29]|uniref:hypothetical protein n=1 Tax=Marinimicrobium sp. C2-29 TaxID=3139825 RepID=UPI003138F2BC